MRLEVIQGRDKGKVFTVDPASAILIGRQPDCQVRLSDPEVSRLHARLLARDGAICVEDVGSTNGTIVNGVMAARSIVPEDAEIVIGSTVLHATGTATPIGNAPSTLRLDDAPSAIMSAMPRDKADMIGPRRRVGLSPEQATIQSICEICQTAAGGTDVPRVLQDVLDRMRVALGADGAAVAMVSNGDWRIVATSAPSDRHDAFTLNRTVVQSTIEQGMSVLYSDAGTGMKPAPDGVAPAGQTSSICTPIKVADRIEGVLLVDRQSRARQFTQEDLRYATTVGNVVAVLLDRQRLEADLQDKARLAAIGETVAGLAHSIKNILFAFRIGIGVQKSYLAARQLDALDSNLQTLSEIEQRISNLVLNMLTYAKDRAPKHERVNVTRTLRAVRDLYTGQAEKMEVELDLSVADDSLCVLGEESALHHVFVNMIVNALDAIKGKVGPGERAIRISASRVTDPARGELVAIRFRDTGCGVPPENLNRIFTTFFSTKGAQGTGLGLSVVRKTVMEHGGEITVNSKVNEGTEFVITLSAANHQGGGNGS
jgi:signal transduction histidine kinase